MASRLALSLACVNALASGFAAVIGGGALVLYSTSTTAPATPDTEPPPGAVELARLAIPLGDMVSDGVCTVPPLDGVWSATGTVGWARVEDENGLGIADPNVGTDDEALVLTSLDAIEGEPASVAAWAFAVPQLMEE